MWPPPSRPAPTRSGFCYPKSPRYVAPIRLRALSRELGVFAAPVLLFVNAASDLVEGALEMMPNAWLQFHGDEHEPACNRYQRPYIRSVPMTDDTDLTRIESEFASAAALLVDAPTDDFGGSGIISHPRFAEAARSHSGGG
jgi:phosphoribosylanthranilate isomerase